MAEMELIPVQQPRISFQIPELIQQLANSGFQAAQLARAVEIYREMISVGAYKILGISGAIIAAGFGGLIRELILRRYVDALVITGATLVHDLIWGLDQAHYHVPAKSDPELRSAGYSRIYDLCLKDEAFVGLERFLKQFSQLSGEYSSPELIQQICSKLESQRSMLTAAAQHRIPVFCPSLHDSVLGIQLVMHVKQLRWNPFKDLSMLIQLCSQSPIGAIILGGGLVKNFILQPMLLWDGYDYLIQICTDRPEFGGISGAQLSEAISWGKLKPQAKHVYLCCDVSIALPIIACCLLAEQG